MLVFISLLLSLLGFCPHSKRLVGYAQDAFDMDVIAAEFKRRYNESDTEPNVEESTDKNTEETNEDATKESKTAEPKKTTAEDSESEEEDDDKVALGEHYMVFKASTWSSGTKHFDFMVARYCLHSLHGRWIRTNLRQITATLAFFGFIVNTNSFDGASENRSAMKQELTLTLKDVLPELLDTSTSAPTTQEEEDTSQQETSQDQEGSSYSDDDEEISKYFDDLRRHPESVDPPTKTYKIDELPWDLKVAYKHPTLDDIIILSAADMPHAIKKQVNAIELSGKMKSKRDLHLNGLPIQLRMGYDAYKRTIDYKSESSTQLYPKLSVDVFEKTSKSRMRVGLAARAVGTSMKRCLENYGQQVKKASPNTFDSYILLCEKTDRFIDIMNGNNKGNKGCSLIDSPNHPHLYELLDYVKFLHQWKAQCYACKERYFYFPNSCHEDTCWVALSLVIMARKQLPEGFAIVQSRGGTDNLEKTFATSRQKNSGAGAQQTDGNLSNQDGAALQDMMRSSRSNVEKRKIFRMGEIEGCKVKKRKFSK